MFKTNNKNTKNEISIYVYNKYLIFFMYHYSDLYNAYHRLQFEYLARTQYPQPQIWLSFALIQKSTVYEKIKSISHMFYRNTTPKQKSGIISISRVQVEMVKDCEFFNSFQSSVTFLYPLKTSEKLWFSDVFRGIEM